MMSEILCLCFLQLKCILEFCNIVFCFSFLVYTVAVQEQRSASAGGIDSTVGESSPQERVPSRDKVESFEPLNLNLDQAPVEEEPHQQPTSSYVHKEFHLGNGTDSASNVEHQFIPSFSGRSPAHGRNREKIPESENLVALRNISDEDYFVSLQLGESESKKKKAL